MFGFDPIVILKAFDPIVISLFF